MTSIDSVAEKEEILKLGIDLVNTDSFLAHIIESLSPFSSWSKSLKASYCSKDGAVDVAIKQARRVTAMVNEKYADVPMALIYKESLVKKSAEIEKLAKPYLD